MWNLLEGGAGLCLGMAIRRFKLANGSGISPKEVLRGWVKEDACRSRGEVITAPKVGAGLLGLDVPPNIPAVNADHGVGELRIGEVGS